VAVALLAGSGVGFAVGRQGGSSVITAATPATSAPVAPTPIAIQPAIGTAVSPGQPPLPTGQRVFVHDSADGIRIRGYLFTYPILPGAPPAACFTGQELRTEISDDVFAASTGGSIMASGGDPLTVIFRNSVGLEEGSPIILVALRSAPTVALVRITFADGTTDQMAPVAGLVALAHHAADANASMAGGGSADALDAHGVVLGTVSLSTPPLPDACKPPLPPAPAIPANLPPPAFAATTAVPASVPGSAVTAPSKVGP
jgi:hypothetical protein